MLDETSYMAAIAVYAGAALLGILLLCFWLRRYLPVARNVALGLLLCALALTPAFPREGVDTMAPALVVVGFQFLTGGLDAAMHAVRPLLFMCGAALVAALLLRITAFRKRAQVD
ncbi:MAG: hypothetical protein NXI15_05835 [Gammaproteobacteria bacterium]|jgi:hypothetical protein|nr:hypothetical protein [Gammaproteobacteria bacterium]